jgi:hypothetical protein
VAGWVDGIGVRKLWTARALLVLAAAALAAVVVEERREQAADDDALQEISAPANTRHAIDLQVDGDARPRAFSTTLYLNWSAERRPRTGSR